MKRSLGSKEGFYVNQQKYFGTDGIRGKVGFSNVNPEFMLKLGWAAGRTIANNGQRKKVVIGKDTRVSGYMLESALEAGFSAAGVDIALLGPMPTPAIAYLTRTLRANAGIVISASHNLFEDNGIKFFSAEGYKLADHIELAIETAIDKPMQIVEAALLGKATRIDDAPGRYIEFCKSTVPSLTRLSGIKLVVDCANGATYNIAPNVFSELGAEVTTINDAPDGFNINQKCGSTSPEMLRQRVLKTKADLGIALDGDGDRLILIDHLGNIIDGDQIIYVITKDRQQRHALRGGVVGTLMSNYGLEQALGRMGVPFLRAQVGDRYILETLIKNGWKLGAESSGHIICLDKTTTGDGIIAALQILACMIKQEKNLHQLTTEIELLPQTLINIKTKNALLLAQDRAVLNLIASVKQNLKGDGRVLLRPSGTEPLLRIMVEGANSEAVELYANQLNTEISAIERSLYRREKEKRK